MFDDDVDDDDDDDGGTKDANCIFRTTVDSPGAANTPPSQGHFDEQSASPLDGERRERVCSLTLC